MVGIDGHLTPLLGLAHGRCGQGPTRCHDGVVMANRGLYRVAVGVVAVILTGACGAPTTVRVTSRASDCAPREGQTDDGSGDTAPLPPGGRRSDAVTDWFARPTPEALGANDAVAVLRVVSRDAPIAAAYDERGGARRRRLLSGSAPQPACSSWSCPR